MDDAEGLEVDGIVSGAVACVCSTDVAGTELSTGSGDEEDFGFTPDD